MIQSLNQNLTKNIMHRYEAKTFNLPTLEGLSEKQIAVHIGLYEGYVKHVNHLREQIQDLTEIDNEKYSYSCMELRRRLGFEFNGMRMHEYYFSQLEEGPKALNSDSVLGQAVNNQYGSWDDFIAHITTVAMSRGIGWTVVYKDTDHNILHTAWVSDHELGQLGGMPVIFALDMWEHAFMVDYTPAEKKTYIEAYFKNVNWDVVNERYDSSAK